MDKNAVYTTIERFLIRDVKELKTNNQEFEENIE